jgi:two-component system chemotaxis response regulator CheB
VLFREGILVLLAARTYSAVCSFHAPTPVLAGKITVVSAKVARFDPYAPMTSSTPPPHWLIVIGGSAGALECVKEVLAPLPVEIPASILVTIHTSATGGNYMPQIFSRITGLSVRLAEDGEPVAAGRVYVARAGLHLKVLDGRIELNRGPREHHTRPAVDVLFRSAARSHGDRVVGVVLSGHGSDGSAGALAIRARGGRILVQSPDEALARGMPQRVIDTAGADLVATAREIGDYLGTLTCSTPSSRGAAPMVRDEETIQSSIQEDIRDQIAGKRDGQTSVLSCPDCGGILWQMDEGRLLDFQCHVGHRYTADTMLVEKTEQLEAALVSALRLLKEKAIILRQTAGRARERGDDAGAARLNEQADLDLRHAELLQRELLEIEPSSLSNATVEEEVARQQH